MGIEELKLVLQAVQGVSDSALWVVIAYFGTSLTKAIMSAGVVLSLAWWIIGTIRHAVERNAFAHQMLDVMDINWFPQDGVDRRKVLKELADRLEASQAR